MRAQEKFDSRVRRGLLVRNTRGQFVKSRMKEAIEVLDVVAAKEVMDYLISYCFDDQSSIIIEQDRFSGRVLRVAAFDNFGQEVAAV